MPTGAENKNCIWYFLAIWIFLCCPVIAQEKPADETFINELQLVELKINNKLKFDSEVLISEDKVFLPLKQIAGLTDVEVEFDRQQRLFSFIERESNSKVIINLINKSIQKSDSVMDISVNEIYPVQKSFFLEDDVLLQKELLEKFLNIRIKIDREALVVNLEADRILKILKKKLVFEDEEEANQTRIKPKKSKKIDIRTIQTNYSTSFNSTQIQSSQANTNTKNFNAGFNTNLIGEVNGGDYRAGPVFNVANDSLFLSSLRQSWMKEIKKNSGLIIGDSNIQLNRLSAPSAEVFGLQIGSRKNLRFNVLDNLSFEGTCEPSSELRIFLNGQLIGRKICKDGKYNFQNIPRLIDPNSVYTIIQKNTDGVEIEIRRERMTFFGDLIPKKEKRWQAYIGRPPLINTVQLLGPETAGFVQPPNRLITGGLYQYGLTERVSIEGAISYDKLLSTPSRRPLSFGLGNGFDKAFFPDPFFLDGFNSSIAISSRPKNNLGLRVGLAASNSKDATLNQIQRSGLGYASFLDFDWRGKKYSTQGGLYYNSPSFYSLGFSSQNEFGGNLSIAGSIGKKQGFNLSASRRLRNLDQKSIGGIRTDSRVRFNHSVRPGKGVFIQNTVNYNDFSNDANSSRSYSVRTAARKRISRKVDLNVSAGIVQQENLKPLVQKNRQVDFSAGSTYRFGPELKNQVSFGGRQIFLNGPAFSNISNRRGIFIEGRFTKGKLVYQPSAQVFFGKGRDQESSFAISNGLFWQQNDGTRIGIEHIFSNSQSIFLLPTLDLDGLDPELSFIRSSVKTTSHTLALNLFSTIGFYDGKPRLLNNSINSGYLKGNVYVDLNNNGSRDQSEPGIKDAKLKFLNKPLLTSPNGDFTVLDVPSGTYEISLDLTSLPININPSDEKFLVEIQARKITEVDFALNLNSGTVSGNLTVKNMKGEKQLSNNIVVIAVNDKGKEVAYTYTDDSGYYSLSELPPGKYKITLDKLDIAKRNLTSDKIEHEVNIPISLDEPVDLSGVDFKITSSSF
ncbi:MAG: hypothetical protein SFU25_07890 [Candidatus Caenarcaniphilales bacterium]|nr:hypothetical protein [Candidatus Caenarcaniphilales bacterium]